MKNKLNRSEYISISVMLFGMFFGAGNLIFPPQLGYNAGTNSIYAFITFILTGVIFPILAVIAVSKSKGLENLASRVNKKFAVIYTLLIFLAIGPGLAIPRNSTVPFEMTIIQLLPEGSNIQLYRFLYTLTFFVVSYLLAINSSKIVDSLGKILTPALIIIIAFLFIGVLFNNPVSIGQPKGTYVKSPLAQGFIDGYNTLDAIAGLNFGFLIYQLIKSYNIKEEKSILNYTRSTGTIAASILLMIYMLLTYMGAISSNLGIEFTNGAQIISYLANHSFGYFGLILVVITFTLACLTTSVGLIITVSDYFHSLKSNISKNTWITITTLVSLILANFGLDKILELSVPTLLILYPFSLSLIVLGLLDGVINFSKLTYVGVAISTFTVAIVNVLFGMFNISIPFITDFIMKIPLSNEGLNWIIPTLGLVLTIKSIERKNRKWERLSNSN